jgi:DNA polymerase
MVGEAPGRLGADLYGIPFSGDRSGVLLQKMLREVGLSQSGPTAVIPRLNRVYLTNLVRCNPRTVDGNNRAPTKEEMGNCANFLWREIQLLKPKVIATLGRHTTEVIVGQHVSSFQYTKPIHDKGFLVFPLHHPGYIIRGGGVQRLSEKKYKKEFWKLKNLIDGLRTLPRTTPYLEI